MSVNYVCVNEIKGLEKYIRAERRYVSCMQGMSEGVYTCVMKRGQKGYVEESEKVLCVHMRLCVYMKTTSCACMHVYVAVPF